MVEGPQPGRGGGQPDPSRSLREAGVGLQRPRSWSLTPGKQMRDAESILEQDSPADCRKMSQ